MEYIISDRTKRKAHKKQVLIYPAEGKSKYKMEVYHERDGRFLGYAGRKGDDDYSALKEKHGKQFARFIRDEFRERLMKRKWEWRLLW